MALHVSPSKYLLSFISCLTSPLSPHPILSFFPFKRHWRDWRSLSAPRWFVWFSLSAFFHLILSCFLSAELLCPLCPFFWLCLLTLHTQRCCLLSINGGRFVCFWSGDKPVNRLQEFYPQCPQWWTTPGSLPKCSFVCVWSCFTYSLTVLLCLYLFCWILHGYVQNGILHSMCYYLLRTVFFFFIVSKTVVVIHYLFKYWTTKADTKTQYNISFIILKNISDKTRNVHLKLLMSNQLLIYTVHGCIVCVWFTNNDQLTGVFCVAIRLQYTGCAIWIWSSMWESDYTLLHCMSLIH